MQKEESMAMDGYPSAGRDDGINREYLRKKYWESRREMKRYFDDVMKFLEELPNVRGTSDPTKKDNFR